MGLLSRFKSFLKDPTGKKRRAIEEELAKIERELARRKEEKVLISPKPTEPEVRPIPKYEDYVQYIDVQFTYRSSESDKSRDVKRATYRIWGESRNSFDSSAYLAEKHFKYKLTGGAAWNVHVVGSGRKQR